MSLLARVRRFAARHSMWRPGTRVIAAVSGGSDSLALLVLLHELQVNGELTVDAVAHLHHGIRADADADAAFVRDRAHALGLDCVVEQVDVPHLARTRKMSVEAAGRSARRDFLNRLLARRGADCVATGHTRDDQAETVLLRVLRGTAARGVAGIAPHRNRRVRPVLCANREELQAELRARGLTWREDPTNRDRAIPRNRVRHELLPYLRAHFNPTVEDALTRLADVTRGEDEWLARIAAAAAVTAMRPDDGGVRLVPDVMQTLPEAIARRVVHLALERLNPGQNSFADVEAVLDVVAGRRRGAEIFGARAEHSAGFVVLVNRASRRASPGAPLVYGELGVPGELNLPDIGVLTAEVTSGDPPQPAGSGDVAWVAADAVGQRLIVRSRRPGDRLRPVGLGGRKKLQDLLVDRKVSRHERDRVPIVTDAHGRIVWVVGHAIGEEFRVTDDTNGVIILKLRRI